jgi:hypothetical protein
MSPPRGTAHAGNSGQISLPICHTSQEYDTAVRCARRDHDQEDALQTTHDFLIIAADRGFSAALIISMYSWH